MTNAIRSTEFRHLSFDLNGRTARNENRRHSTALFGNGKENYNVNGVSVLDIYSGFGCASAGFESKNRYLVDLRKFDNFRGDSSLKNTDRINRFVQHDMVDGDMVELANRLGRKDFDFVIDTLGMTGYTRKEYWSQVIDKVVYFLKNEGVYFLALHPRNDEGATIYNARVSKILDLCQVAAHKYNKKFTVILASSNALSFRTVNVSPKTWGNHGDLVRQGLDVAREFVKDYVTRQVTLNLTDSQLTQVRNLGIAA